MAFVAHGLIALCYLALAAVIGLALSRGGVGAEPSLAALGAGAVMFAGAFLHQAMVGMRRNRDLAAVLHRMGASQPKLGHALAAARDDVRQLTVAFDQAAQKLPSSDTNEVISEMRVLQTRLHQLSPQPAAAAAGEAADPEAPEGPAPAAPEPPAALSSVDFEEALAIVSETLQDNRVDVYLQPVVSLPQRKTAFYETFTRLRAGDGTQIEPATYLDVAERAGLISVIDNSLLFRCVQLVRKTQRRNLNRGVFCNISPHTLRDSSFFPEFVEFMNHNARLAASLIFEFAQSDLANHDDGIARNLDRLGEMGFRFSVDQIGSLELDVEELLERRVSFVKIEAAALLEQPADPESSIAVHRMKHALDEAGIDLIAEKIEQEQQLVELLDYGIDFGQGYLFGEPRPSRTDD